MSINDVWYMVSLLIPENLVQVTGGNSPSVENKSFFSFLHVPVFEQKKGDIDRKRTNAFFRNVKPYLLNVIKELFTKIEEREAVYSVYKDLIKAGEIEFETVEHTFGAPIARKIAVTTKVLEPFVTINEDYTRLNLNKDTIGLNKVLLDSLLYSVLTTTMDDSLMIYNNAIATLVEKDKGWAKDIDYSTRSLSDLTTALLEHQKIFK